jgi:hypothetical protein
LPEEACAVNGMSICPRKEMGGGGIGIGWGETVWRKNVKIDERRKGHEWECVENGM